MKIEDLPQDIQDYITDELGKSISVPYKKPDGSLGMALSWSETLQGNNIWLEVNQGNFKPFYEWLRKHRAGKPVMFKDVGAKVVRNEGSWNFGNQDTYKGKKLVGTITDEALERNWVYVDWNLSSYGAYRAAKYGICSLQYATEEEIKLGYKIDDRLEHLEVTKDFLSFDKENFLVSEIDGKNIREYKQLCKDNNIKYLISWEGYILGNSVYGVIDGLEICTSRQSVTTKHYTFEKFKQLLTYKNEQNEKIRIINESGQQPRRGCKISSKTRPTTVTKRLIGNRIILKSRRTQLKSVKISGSAISF